jgi:hypothetical protein
MTLLFLAACSPPEAPQPEVSLSPAPAFSVARDDGLTADAEAALLRMPGWLRPDLRLALAGQKNDRQDLLAAAILSLDDPALLDEVGFAMAHLSPEVLKQDNFYPELLVENARMIYEVDPLLDYVELVEEGTPEVDADWTTTTRYQIEVGGVVTTVDLPADDYYWYIVHPRIEDENPWYIDAWEECTRSGLECAADPETGTFWRSFLWSLAAETCPEGASCPVVQDYLPGAQVLYGAADGDDAVHRVAGMLLDSPGDARWMNFGAYGERSIQPNRIYALGRGNCGEWADMTSAISRTALIPNVNVTPSSWDHTWSAFRLPSEDRWVAWEPVNWWFDYAYGSSYATYATRGDASVWYQTEQYNPNTATLEVEVKDADNAPVDGATVTLWSPYDTSWWYAGELVTDADGLARFTVGADLEFAYMVVSELGGGESLDGTVPGIAAGGSDSVKKKLSGAMPVVPTPGEGDALGALEVAVSVAAEGRRTGLSWRLEDTSSQVTTAPALVTWVLSRDAYAAFEAGEDFEVVPALDPDDGGYVVVGNLASLGTAAVGDVTVATQADGYEDGTFTLSFALLPGEWVAIGIGE